MKSPAKLQAELAKLEARGQRDRQRIFALKRELRLAELRELVGVAAAIRYRGNVATLMKMTGSIATITVDETTMRVPVDEVHVANIDQRALHHEVVA